MKQNNKQKGALLISFFVVFVIGFVGGSVGTYLQEKEKLPSVPVPSEIKQQIPEMNEKANPQIQEATQEELQFVEGRVVKLHGYYLKNLDGMVVVYEDDPEQPYLVTDIRVEDLPINLQEEIKDKLEIADEKSLYDFLESYTS